MTRISGHGGSPASGTRQSEASNNPIGGVGQTPVQPIDRKVANPITDVARRVASGEAATARTTDEPSNTSAEELVAQLDALSQLRQQFLDSRSQVVENHARELLRLGGYFPDAPTLSEARLRPRDRDGIPTASVIIEGKLIRFPMSEVASEFADIDAQDSIVTLEMEALRERLRELGEEYTGDPGSSFFRPDTSTDN